MRLGREKYVLLYLGGDNEECGEAAREMIGFAEQINTSVLKINWWQRFLLQHLTKWLGLWNKVKQENKSPTAVRLTDFGWLWSVVFIAMLEYDKQN